MSDILLSKKSRKILRAFSMEKSDNLLCPILRVLQMRHSDLDVKQATRVIRNVLESEV